MKNDPVKKGSRRIPLILTEEQIKALDEKVFAHASKKEEVSRAFFIGQWIDLGCPMVPRKKSLSEIVSERNALQRQIDAAKTAQPASSQLQAYASAGLPVSQLEAQEKFFGMEIGKEPWTLIHASVVRAWRRKNRLSLDELAIRLGCSERLVSAWENEEDFEVPRVIQERMINLIHAGILASKEPSPPAVKEDLDSTLQAMPGASDPAIQPLSPEAAQKTADWVPQPDTPPLAPG